MVAKIKIFQPKEKQEAQKRLDQLKFILVQYPELNKKKVSSLLWEEKKK